MHPAWGAGGGLPGAGCAHLGCSELQILVKKVEEAAGRCPSFILLAVMPQGSLLQHPACSQPRSQPWGLTEGGLNPAQRLWGEVGSCLLLGPQIFLLPSRHRSKASSHIKGGALCARPGEGSVPTFPDVTPWPRTLPALAPAGLALPSPVSSCFSTALRGGTEFSPLCLAAGTRSLVPRMRPAPRRGWP